MGKIKLVVVVVIVSMEMLQGKNVSTSTRRDVSMPEGLCER